MTGVLDETDRENLAASIAHGVRWWRDTEQPDGSLVTHFGESNAVGNGVGITFSVGGWHDHYARASGVVILDAGWDRDDEGESVIRRLTEEDVEEVTALLEAEGLTIDSQWNGAGCQSGSWGIDGAVNPSLAASHQKYQDGCPDHGSVFCGPSSHREDERDCTWYSGSRDRLIPPGWVAGPAQAEPSAPSPTLEDRNLEVVRRAVAELRSTLPDLGIHPETINAGRMGDIVGEDGSLEFIEREGLGVILTAEGALQIARLARLADQLGLREGDT